ncbi:MAG: ATP-binding protein [Spirochaetales bacterium]|nr:ATP-binding protein [Calditrichota bacterium]MBN2657181.1 ATP-binding protein [Spirochaetales bacterium]
MKLRRIEVENFRGYLKPFAIDFDDFTAIIGKNDIGKSTILSALTIFLEGDGCKIDSGDGCIHGDPSNVRISCDFDNPPESVIIDTSYSTSLTDECLLLENGSIRLTKIYDCTKSTIKPQAFIDAEHHPVFGGNSLLPLTISDLKKEAQKLNIELETGEATAKAKIRKAIIERSTPGSFEKTNIRIPAGKNGANEIWEQLLNYLPHCALFISDRSSTDKDDEAQSPLKIAVQNALDEIQPQLDEIAEFIENKVQNVANRTLEKLNEMNSNLASELSTSLREKPKWKDIFKYTLQSDSGIPLDKRGSGVRRMVLLNFFRAEAERKASEGSSRPILYAIEEPETSQHPEHQKLLIKALLELSENNDQVVITSHAPGLIGEVPAECVRFIDENSGEKKIRSLETEEHISLFQSLAEKMGLLPDNQIKVIICVEGVNDVRFLKHVSRILKGSGEDVPDLSTDHRFALLPLNGSNLIDFVNLNLLKHFNRPEYHIYDRDDLNTYSYQSEDVNNRNDCSKAVVTKKRYMESYIHPEAIKRTCGFEIEIDDETDYTARFATLFGQKKSRAKAHLADIVAASMSKEEILERDNQREIITWLTEIKELAAL